MTRLLTELFSICEHDGGSDIHLTTGAKPRMRVNGALKVLPDIAPIDEAAMTGILADLGFATIPDDSHDGAITSPSGGRYRFNVFREQDRAAVALRLLDSAFHTYAELGLPTTLERFCDEPHGLFIVSGPTGSGKSTTLATMIHTINLKRDGHIITIEDPIEYLHTSERCLVHQRQVGRDTVSFNDALVEALRQDPDVILVGEMRDLATVRTAMRAAETGHLVLTTLHAGDTVGAIERLISVFPSEEQSSARHQLALILRGILAQRLLPLKSGHGRVPAYELLVNTTATANLIATGRTAQIYSALETGSHLGMCTMERTLKRLAEEGKINAQRA